VIGPGAVAVTFLYGGLGAILGAVAVSQQMHVGIASITESAGLATTLYFSHRFDEAALNYYGIQFYLLEFCLG